MKKKLFSIVFGAILMVFATTTSFAVQGNGTEESPYLVTTEAELMLAKDFPESHFLLINDITVSNTSAELGDFKGVFDGNNKTINIGFTSNAGTIKNLNVINTKLLDGDNDGTIENCNVSIDDKPSFIYTCVICKYNRGIIKSCNATVKNVTLSCLDGGGIVGVNDRDGVIEQCSFESENCMIKSTEVLSSNYFCFSGIAGDNVGTITECYSKIVSPSFYSYERIYGISDSSDGTVENCYTILPDGDNIYPGLPDTYTNCYYVDGTSGGTVDGVSKTLLAMTMKATYTDWDFDTVWAIDENKNNGYPYLQWEARQNQVSSPASNIESGAVISGTNVILSSATDGATIYYTTDGTTPTTESLCYTEPIVIDREMTIKTMAVKEGMKDSDVKEYLYTLVSDTAPVIVLGNATGKAGGTVNVTLALKNNPGIIAAELMLNYDSTYLELVDVVDDGKLGATLFGDNKLKIPYIMSWNDDTGRENITYNGTFATLQFKIKEDAPVGRYAVEISYENGEIYDFDLKPVEFLVQNTAVIVTDFVSGDVNGDKMVTSMDRTILARYLTGWDGYTDATINFNASDVNGDGKVTSMDRTILARHLVGWDGYETLPIN